MPELSITPTRDRGGVVVELSNQIDDRIKSALERRQQDGTLRSLSPRVADSGLIDLSNNDYLRIASHPQVLQAAKRATEEWGVSASASPLISGYTSEHSALELRLCEWAGFPFGLVWNSGYAANQAVLSQLPEKGDLVLADRLIHQSMISGLLRSGARLQRYRHLDCDHLESLLEKASPDRAVFVVTESVFSMDGDYPNLERIAELKERFGFIWIVDEAHAIGWYGKRGSGLVESVGIGKHVDVFVGTLGKGLGSMGAFTLFRKACYRDFFINFSGEFIYSTYLAPACAAGARAAVDLVESMEPDRLRWQERSRSLRRRIAGAQAGDSPIIPVEIGDNRETMKIAGLLRDRGFVVGAIRPPTVPAGSSRLRISLNMGLSDDQIDGLVASLQEVRQ
ncbi:MAG: 8-amino-7-oxononanoate synthase [Verrucomicrobiota bacterium]